MLLFVFRRYGARLIMQIFNLLGQPSDDVWPGFSALPVVKTINPVGPP
jgi:cell division cycle 2-like protein